MIFVVPVDNRTPFSVMINVQLNDDGQEALTVMFSASFELSETTSKLEPTANPWLMTLGDFQPPPPARYDSDTYASKPQALTSRRQWQGAYVGAYEDSEQRRARWRR